VATYNEKRVLWSPLRLHSGVVEITCTLGIIARHSAFASGNEHSVRPMSQVQVISTPGVKVGSGDTTQDAAFFVL